MADLSYKEYIVRREQTYLAPVLVAVYAFLSAVLAFVILWYMVLPLALLATALVALLVHFTWPLCKVEYEYITDGSSVTFAVVRGHRRREVLSVPLKSFSTVAPADEAHRGKWDAGCRRYDFRSSKDVPHGYFALFTDAHGERTVVFFDGYSQLIDLCFFRNAPATERRDGLPLYE